MTVKNKPDAKQDNKADIVAAKEKDDSNLDNEALLVKITYHRNEMERLKKLLKPTKAKPKATLQQCNREALANREAKFKRMAQDKERIKAALALVDKESK